MYATCARTRSLFVPSAPQGAGRKGRAGGQSSALTMGRQRGTARRAAEAARAGEASGAQAPGSAAAASASPAAVTAQSVKSGAFAAIGSCKAPSGAATNGLHVSSGFAPAARLRARPSSYVRCCRSPAARHARALRACAGRVPRGWSTSRGARLQPPQWSPSSRSCNALHGPFVRRSGPAGEQGSFSYKSQCGRRVRRAAWGAGD